MQTASDKTAWVISDGAAGNENQALALGEALDLRVECLRLATHAPWRWASPRLLPFARRAFGHGFSSRLRAPWPDVAIGCGRQAALALRLITRHSAGTCRTIQILDPRIDPGNFSLVITPRHDHLTGDNVIATLGGIHRVNDDWLADAREAFADLERLPAPRHALLLGGPTRPFPLGPDQWKKIAEQVLAMLGESGGSLMVSSSRRTPDWVRDAARQAFHAFPGRQWHGSADGPNPYPGFLGWADRLVVTPDSVNMLSEAAATRAPVWTTAPPPRHGKLADFVRELHAHKRIAYPGEPAPRATLPLSELSRVVEEIRRRFGWQ